MSAHSSIESEILEVFQAYWDLYTARDRNALSFFPTDTTGFGTGTDEVVADKEALRQLLTREFEEMPVLPSMQFLWKRVKALGRSGAVLEAELQAAVPLDEGSAYTFRFRITYVFENRDGRWLIVHQHGSVPWSYQPEGKAFPLEALKARNRELERLVAERTEALQQALDHLKATQQQLIQHEKLASLGELTAGIAHEIKNPLNFVNNFAELMGELVDELGDELHAEPGDSGADNPHQLFEILADLKANAEQIAKHGRRADGIVSAMMRHASGGTGQQELTDVNTLLEEYINLAYHGRRGQSPTHDSKRAQKDGFNLTVEREYDESVGAVKMVPQDMGRVFLNLLGNAFDAVFSRKQQMGDGFEPKVRVQTQREDDALVIRVQDNGPGIPENLREKIFMPFFTTKPTGSGAGLGLSLSYDIVTQGHGGTLTVESEEGEGATFTITLPC